MTRWMIEKDGTGIEKSGTGIEKSGTGIEKSGTGIEKSGTGIEKSGTGIRKGLLALSLASLTFSAQLSASEPQAEGTFSIAVQNDSLLVSWIIDGSIFSGVSPLTGTSANAPVAVGANALRYNSTGLNNTAVGSQALCTNNSGSNNFICS